MPRVPVPLIAKYAMNGTVPDWSVGREAHESSIIHRGLHPPSDTILPNDRQQAMQKCKECGAAYDDDSKSCATRFEALLALDHSRTEPWGSRHGLAFSVFALQHPSCFPPDVVERAWLLLYKVYREGDDYKRVTSALRRLGRKRPNWAVPPVPSGRPAAPYRVTIASLGSFAATTYAELVDQWCKATLEAWLDVAKPVESKANRS